MGMKSRRKGKIGEYEARDFLRKWFPAAQRGANQSRSGRDAADVENTPFWLESKLGAKPNIRGALRQAVLATDGRPVLVYVRDDFSEPMFVLTKETMSLLLDMAYGEFNSGT